MGPGVFSSTLPPPGQEGRQGRQVVFREPYTGMRFSLQCRNDASVASQIISKPQLPPHREELLIFTKEVCGFTISPRYQSQRASPRWHLLPRRKTTG